MKKTRRLGLAGLLVAVGLALASCGGAGGSASPSAGDGSREDGHRAAHNEDSSMGHGNGSGQEQHSGMGHDQGHGGQGMGGEEMARRMLEDENGDYSDRRFIDMMVPHHQGAVEMAEVALENSDREEILDLSRDIVRTQNAEIEELRSIKEEEFGTSKIPMNMGEDDMEMMGMMDPDELARQKPFHKAFIDAMIPRHQSTIDMADVVIKESENPALRRLAADIVEAQEREIAQMKAWREEWYPES